VQSNMAGWRSRVSGAGFLGWNSGSAVSLAYVTLRKELTLSLIQLFHLWKENMISSSYSCLRIRGLIYTECLEKCQVLSTTFY
jgi:hypothetical protein